MNCLIPVNASNFDYCCARALDGGTPLVSFIKLPFNEVVGVSGPLKWEFSGLKGVDASTISVESEDKTKTVTIRGAVKSAAQRDLVDKVATQRADGFKIVNELQIVK